MTVKKSEIKSDIPNTQYIIGIGASAGGLEAIHDLFDYMPQNTGFSFVVIQHLSPDYKSLMAELLSRHTQMQVCEAEDGMVVEPNCIYVIPSKKLMTIRKGHLVLIEKLKSKLPNNAIDVFMESLAKEHKNKSIGVVLSGTGTDGSKGVAAIKKEGGIVIVQDPLTAAFDGMPLSAVDTGNVDLILPPEMIGEELANYLKDLPLLKTFNPFTQDDEESLREILDLLNRVTKRDFNHYKRPTLFRRLAKRMSEVGINSIVDYKDHLLTNEEEVKTLSKEFLINVTKFFRDAEAFETLRTEALPSIIDNHKKEEAIKIWSVACSSGEEAYSITILFLEYLERNNLPTSNLKVFATDIDVDALEIASRGLYSDSIRKDVSQQLLEKYFTQEGNMFRVSGELRKHVVFANHDILKDPPFSHLDLIICRNMFIYVNPMLQQKILRKFHFALKQDAYLMMGPSENIDILKDYVQEINRKWKLYRCVVKARVVENDTLIMPLDKTMLYMGGKPQKTLNSNLAEIFKDLVLESKKIAALFIDKEFNLKQAIGSYKNFLQFPEGNFNFNLLKLVQGDIAIALGVSVRKAISLNEKVVMNNVLIHEKETTRLVSVTVKPYIQNKDYQQSFLCIILEEEVQAEPKSAKIVFDNFPESADRIRSLEQELRDTRENLQAVIEEMETANEELQSSTEEMISTNEELQSTNEELQSLNEELHTVSGEHQLKIKELHDLNDDLNNYFNNSGIGHIMVDKKMIIRKFSPAATSMINLISTDIGRSIVHITTNIKDFDFVDAIREVLRTSLPFEKEISLGENTFYLMRIAPFIKRDQSVDGVVINITDISESKRLSSIVEGIFIASTNGITALRAIRDKANKIIDFEYQTANTSAEEFFGMSRFVIPGKRLLDIFPVVDKKLVEQFIDVVEEDKEANFELNNKSTGRWYTINAVKMLDGLVITHSDITEQKKAAGIIAHNYEELEHASQQLKNSNTQLERSNLDLLQFASVASHDLKEPLRKVQAFGNILRTKIAPKLEHDELNYFDRMISSSDRMQTLIEDVLSLSKLSDNQVPKDKIELGKVITNILEDLEIIIKEKKAVVEIKDLPQIPAVRWQMQQLFQNLISNALKFSSTDNRIPHITIESKAITPEHEAKLNINAKDFACVSVRDNGIGFEKEYDEKIFGLFQRLNGRQYEGTGIGLAIAKKIVENHNGHICSYSELDKGAEFFVFLPV